MANKSLFYKQILQLEENILSGPQHGGFCETAAKYLKDFPYSTFEGMKSLRECLPHTRFIPQYYSATGFGKCNLTLVNNNHFMILAMYMDDISTEIHDHPFEGAFSPLAGNPVQLMFSYASAESISEFLEVGELTCTDYKLLTPGDVTVIKQGMIHMLARPRGNQFSLLVCRHLPPQNRGNHFYLYPGLKIKNRSNWSYLTRLISTFQGVSPSDQQQVNDLLGSLDSDELIQLFFRIGPELADKELGDNDRFNIRQLIMPTLMQSELWRYIPSHLAFLESTKAKVSILIGK